MLPANPAPKCLNLLKPFAPHSLTHTTCLGHDRYRIAAKHGHVDAQKEIQYLAQKAIDAAERVERETEL